MWFALLLRRLAALPRRGLRLLWRAAEALGRALRGAWRGLRAPAGRLGVQVAVTALALAGTLAAGWFLVPGAGPAWSFGSEPSPEPEEAPLVLTPENAPAAGLPAESEGLGGVEETGGTGGAEGVGDTATGSPTDGATTSLPGNLAEIASGLETWAQSLSHLGIPQRALVAYGRAELVSAVENPGCNLPWTTLAGIGATETNHGTTGGNSIQADGTTMTEIIGAGYDEMGPMQFLPSTWESWKADGDKDGVYNPHDIDDAVTAAANYLCHGGRDLTTPTGWYEAVHSYNPRDDYVQKVFDRADEYGRRSTG